MEEREACRRPGRKAWDLRTEENWASLHPSPVHPPGREFAGLGFSRRNLDAPPLEERPVPGGRPEDPHPWERESWNRRNQIWIRTRGI